MVGRTHGKEWMWSLLAACILTGIFYVLLNIGPFAQRFGYFSFIVGSPPAVTTSIITSEFTTNLSRSNSHFGWTSASQIVFALLVYSTVAWWTARRTGAVKTGFLVGVWAALFYGLINFVIAAAHVLQYIRSFSISGHESDALRMQAYISAIIIIDGISGVLFGFVVFGLLPGIVGGIIGGLLGRRYPAPLGNPLTQREGA
jgi:glucan phosphoethanolaminetransferase (alkaline phosphatase superfamily)